MSIESIRSIGAARRTASAVLLLATVAVIAAATPRPAAAAAPEVHALTGVRIVAAPGRVVDEGTVVLRDGRIVAAGADVVPPPDARIWDRSGATVYPGLIEPYAVRPWPERREDEAGPATAPEDRSGHPNPVVHAERRMVHHAADRSAARALREAGFTAAVVAPRDGVFRGLSALVGLGDAPLRERILLPGVAHCVDLDQRAGEGYPQSLMGAIALTRQTVLDAAWYRRAREAFARDPIQRRPPFDAALEALAPAAAGEEPVVLESEGLPGVLRAARLAAELDLDAWLVASGAEYQRIELIAQNAPAAILLPVDFPDPPEGTSGDSLSIELADLRHWQRAPGNPAALLEAAGRGEGGAGFPVLLTSHRLDRPQDLHARLARAIEAGLAPEDALAALTTVPARLLGVADRMGTIEPGKAGDLVVTDGELFTPETRIREVWIDGRRHEVRATEPPEVEPAGTWELQIDAGGMTVPARLVLSGEAPSLHGTLTAQGQEIPLTRAEVSGSTVEITFEGARFGMPGTFSFDLKVEGDRARGAGDGPPGPFTLEGTRVSGPPEPEADTRSTVHSSHEEARR